MNWTLLGWLFFAASSVQMLMGSMAAAAATFTMSLFSLAVADIIKAIRVKAQEAAQ